ncbi:MBL fold metallo-hydrolase [Candidatus Oscillochloris fontis]|uniref:MBL fold metallo-hydrolase n=1 Tax=Candidatus Oscillochloris fontis TaxID=2496868 RepID=UPI0015821B4B|nr:MBL fold metallo-hydrolase [Candidatus Oscillochloris fontis]
MQLRFLGTGTSMGVPVIGCDCAVCTSDDPRNRRMRTSALLRTADRTILIDAGPDFRLQALSAGLRQIDAVLLTHAHFDHIAGIDDLRPLSEHGDCLPIFGSPRTIRNVRSRFDYAFKETSAGSTRPRIELHSVEASFQIGQTSITPLAIIHGTWEITAYRMGGLGYVTDASSIPPSSWEALRNLDVLVLNALRYKPHPTHFTLDEALAVIGGLQPRRAFLVHMTHAFDHARASAELPAGVAFAYDGLEIEIAR